MRSACIPSNVGFESEVIQHYTDANSLNTDANSCTGFFYIRWIPFFNKILLVAHIPLTHIQNSKITGKSLSGKEKRQSVKDTQREAVHTPNGSARY